MWTEVPLECIKVDLVVSIVNSSVVHYVVEYVVYIIGRSIH